MTKEQILAQSEAIFKEVVEIRRHIHRHPELSFEEYKTSEYITSILEREGIEYKIIAKTGVLVKIEGKGDLKNAKVLRADLDALPIYEKTGLKYSSINGGVMHACGHDIHSAVLLGALTVLNRNRESIDGTLFGLFQPAEEVNPGGALAVLRENPFDGYSIKAFIGEHIDPSLPVGLFAFKGGEYMASSDDIMISVKGRGGHGAAPHKLNDPIVAAAAIVLALQQVVSRLNNPLNTSVVSIGKVVAEGATNIIPDEVKMEGTLRTFSPDWREEAKRHIKRIADNIGESYGVECDVIFEVGSPAVINDVELTDEAMLLTKELFGSDAAIEHDLSTTAEDFGYFTKLYPSLFYRLGTERSDKGITGSLHSPILNPDEKSLKYGVAQMVNLALNLKL